MNRIYERHLRNRQSEFLVAMSDSTHDPISGRECPSPTMVFA
ncbi:MAG: hypothetical protein WC647_05145 [Desulfomonilaceae bacterium]